MPAYWLIEIWDNPNHVLTGEQRFHLFSNYHISKVLLTRYGLLLRADREIYEEITNRVYGDERWEPINK